MVAREVNVEQHRLRAVGTGIHAAPERSADAPDATVPAPAADPVSVQAAQAFAARLARLGAHSATVGEQVRAAGNLARADAETYAEQDELNARHVSLNGDGNGGAAVSAPQLPAVAPAVAQMPAAKSAVTPTTGRQIAELVH